MTTRVGDLHDGPLPRGCLDILCIPVSCFLFRPGPALDQYASEPMTSPPLRVPRPHQTWRLTELLTKCTEPSAKHTFTPPGCRLFAEGAP